MSERKLTVAVDVVCVRSSVTLGRSYPLHGLEVVRRPKFRNFDKIGRIVAHANVLPLSRLQRLLPATELSAATIVMRLRRHVNRPEDSNMALIRLSHTDKPPSSRSVP